MARPLGIGCVLLIVSVLGRTSLAGINDPKDKDPGSSGTSGSTASVDRFLGTWNTTTGTQKITGCSAQQTHTRQQLSLLVTRGAAPGTVIVGPALYTNCHIDTMVVGDVAKLLEQDQTCTISVNNENDTYTYVDPTTFTLTTDEATTANVHISASVFVDVLGETCAYEETSVYTKQATSP